MKTVKIATNLRFQNLLFHGIEVCCEFVFVTLHRTSLYCDVHVLDMVNITIITFSELRMVVVNCVKISFQKVYSFKSYKPKHHPERYVFNTCTLLTSL